MTSFLESYALWLADYYLLATLLLAGALVAVAVVKQPAQKLAIAKSSLVALALLAGLIVLPGSSLVHLVSNDRPAVDTRLGTDRQLAAMDNRTSTKTAVPAAEYASEAPGAPLPSSMIATSARDWPHMSWSAVFALVHLLGSGVVAVWLIAGLVAAHRLRRGAQPAPEELATMFGEILPPPQGSGLQPTLLVSDEVDVAVALGILRPAVLFPIKWVESQTSDELRTVLAHESAHFRNRDLHWLAASRGLMIVLWAQPLYWLLRRRMRLDQESLADAATADLIGRRRYAEQLVAWAREFALRPSARLSSSVGLWEGKSQLGQRLGILIDERFTVLGKCPPGWRNGWTVAAVVSAFLLSLVTIEPAQWVDAEGIVAVVDEVRIAQNTTETTRPGASQSRPPALLSYGDGKADGKHSYGGTGFMIRFELPEGVTKARGLRIHGSRYGYPQAPDEDFEITFLSEDRDEILDTEAAPYRLFKRGKERWVRVLFDKEVELPKKFWVALNFNAQQTKGVYVSYDTSTKGKYSRVGLPGDEEEPKKTDFGGDWMVQVMLPRPAR